MFARTERCKSDGSCVTMPICRRKLSWVTERRSCPSIRIAPSSGSKNRSSRLTSVD
jgi:hypothetical protein